MAFGLKAKMMGTALVALAALVAGCGDSSGDTKGGGGSGGTTTAGGGGTGGDTGGTGGTPVEPEFVAKFDPTKYELAEGLFVSKGTAYVGFAPLGKIVSVGVADGTVSDFGALPPIPQNGGFMLGIVVNAAGDVLVGFGGGPGVDVKNGVYKIPAAGGSVDVPFAADPEMNFPNGLLLEGSDVVVADSGGSIFKVAQDGTVTKWASDPSLSGMDTSCQFGAPFPIGANGIVRIEDAYYVANTNLGQIVKIPINGDGSAGAASVFAGPDCEVLGGIDGIAVDIDSKSILGVLNGQSKLVRIDPAGTVTDVFEGKPLDNPASIHVDATTAYITNSAFFDMAMPEPGLLSLALE